MDIKMTSRNFHLETDMHEYMEKRLSKLDKLLKIYSCEVILKKEKEITCIEIVMFLKGATIIAKESSKDLHSAVDLALENVKKQLRRMHEKKRTMKRRSHGADIALAGSDEGIDADADTMDLEGFL